jgi:hypothetical protein
MIGKAVGQSGRFAARVLPVIALACLVLLPAISKAAPVYDTDTLPDDLQSAGVTSISKVSVAPRMAGETVSITDTLYDGTTLFAGISFTRIQLDLPGAGLLRVQLSDLAFPALAGLLSVTLVQGGDVKGILPAPGLLELEVSGPGRYFAYVYAVGAPNVSAASFYLNITQTRQEAIPLPAALWLLLSGLLAFGRAATYRRRAAS